MHWLKFDLFFRWLSRSHFLDAHWFKVCFRHREKSNDPRSWPDGIELNECLIYLECIKNAYGLMAVKREIFVREALNSAETKSKWVGSDVYRRGTSPEIIFSFRFRPVHWLIHTRKCWKSAHPLILLWGMEFQKSASQQRGYCTTGVDKE